MMMVLKGSIHHLQTVIEVLFLILVPLYLQTTKIVIIKKINILSTSRINKICFAIKVFNYLYARFKNVSLEDAETPVVKSILQYILTYYINAKISTQTHLIQGAGPVW